MLKQQDTIVIFKQLHILNGPLSTRVTSNLAKNAMNKPGTCVTYKCQFKLYRYHSGCTDTYHNVSQSKHREFQIATTILPSRKHQFDWCFYPFGNGYHDVRTKHTFTAKDPKYVIEKEAAHRNMLVLVIVGNDSAQTYPISIIAPVWYLLNPIILMPIRQNETPKTLLMIQFFVITQ